MTHRLTKPEHQFTKQELVDVILGGNDRYNNSLIIDFNGYPKLVRWINNEDIRYTQNYAVRYETFPADKGEVGDSSNLYYIDQIYVSLLEAWLEHLKTGRSIYTDYAENKLSSDEILNTVTKLHIALF
ncbi:MAG: protein kinase [Clostridium lundense]|nr:protein kinase [Clostridium lundense]